MPISIYTCQEQFNIELAREYSATLELHNRLAGYPVSLHGSIQAKAEMLHHSKLKLHRIRKQFPITLLN